MDTEVEKKWEKFKRLRLAEKEDDADKEVR